MTYTDIQLKQTLAKMLPGYASAMISTDDETVTYHVYTSDGKEVLDTELLHLCWLVEETITTAQVVSYYSELCNLLGDGNGLPQWTKVHATWQQRTIALAKVKGIKIV